MFVLSLIPLHLFTDSDGIPVNNLNQADVLEHQIMKIEAELTSVITGQYIFWPDASGITTTNVDSLRQQLTDAREQELNLVNSSGNISNNDSQARLDSITRTKSVVDQRLQDLDALSQAIVDGNRLSYIVSGVDNTSIQSAANEKTMVMNYKKELDTAEGFWKTLIESKEKAKEISAPTVTGENTATAVTPPQANNNVSEITNNQQVVDPNLLTKMAISERKIADLQSLFSNIPQRANVQEINSKLEDIKNKLQTEQQKLTSSNPDSSTQEKADDLKKELKSLLNEKSISELLEGIQDSIKTSIQEEIGTLLEVFGNMNGML